ncbi:MAG TPA: SDR family oxidoreductase [Spirochaetia bacterium]|nr:SDR family oxidoreductase [Spirochaetia bacterium]
MRSGLMKGKIVLITGATDGIGKVTARELADDGAQVIMVARNRAKAESVRAWIREATGSSSTEVIIADLSVQAQVRAAAAELVSRFGALDVLVNNAGGTFTKRTESADGIEMTFALNHLAPFLLTNLLLDCLRRRAPSRIVTVSSHAHESASMDFDDLEGRQGYNGWRAYGQSKLANLLFTYELARRLEGSGVTANALHPGFVATQFGKNNGGFMRFAMTIAHRLGAISPEEGARTSVYVASSPEVQGVTGKYFMKSRQALSKPASLDRESQRRLWEISCQMTGLPVAD